MPASAIAPATTKITAMTPIAQIVADPRSLSCDRGRGQDPDWNWGWS
ncbi:hypothetical protein GCM10017673_25590 [Streptosporangium violaceochromogenes]|nr:hypothetical protein GCM10017673_25590 [Streptosporangium violaceochromogenes]